MATGKRDTPLNQQPPRKRTPKSALTEAREVQLTLTPFEWALVDDARVGEDLTEFVSAAVRQYLLDHHTALGREIMREGEKQIEAQIAAAYADYPDEEERVLQDAILNYQRQRLMADEENRW